MIEGFAYAASAIVLAAYCWMVKTGAERPFHWANALGFAPVLASEVVARAYPPMMLTAAFGVIGWIGIARGAS